MAEYINIHDASHVQVITLDKTANGTRTAKMESKRKVVDDQTRIVAETFNRWRKEEGSLW